MPNDFRTLYRFANMSWFLFPRKCLCPRVWTEVGDVFRFPNVPALSVMEQSLAHGFSFLLQKNTRLKLSREWIVIAALPLAWFMASRWHFPAQRSVAEIWCLRTDLSECTGQCGSGGHYLRGTRTNFLIGEIYLGVATPRNRPMKWLCGPPYKISFVIQFVLPAFISFCRGESAVFFFFNSLFYSG